MADLPRRRPFIGRATELARLRSALDRVAEQREGRTVVIGGEAGIGKSQLIDRFVAQIGQTARVEVMRDGATSQITVPISGYDRPIVKIEEIADASPEQRRSREQWLIGVDAKH